ncbi:MAG TPA: DUF4349 domain-containing protein [Candidatus Limnocylindrales bacterium]|nr:DUF4349 domain-containing protein [Candidatus Limnocylindrales bacterium]
MDDETGYGPGKGTYLAIIGLVAVAMVVALLFLGGQTTSILSNVGNAIGNDRDEGDTTGNLPDEGGGVTDTTDSDGKGGQVADAEATAPELLIIRTGQLEIEVADLDAAVAGARSGVIAVGGYVSSSEERAGDDAAATVTFRVPADRWDDALDAVRGVGGSTRHLQVQTQAVTGQVIDLGARITNLRATEAALQAIMAQATKIPDVLEVQGKLTEVRGEIERLSAEKAHLEEQAAYGTLTVTFSLPVPPAVEEVKAGWDPATDADAAAGTLIKLGQRAVSFGIWVAIVGLPIAFILLAGLTLVLVARRLIGRAQPRLGES